MAAGALAARSWPVHTALRGRLAHAHCRQHLRGHRGGHCLIARRRSQDAPYGPAAGQWQVCSNVLHSAATLRATLPMAYWTISYLNIDINLHLVHTLHFLPRIVRIHIKYSTRKFKCTLVSVSVAGTPYSYILYYSPSIKFVHCAEACTTRRRGTAGGRRWPPRDCSRSTRDGCPTGCEWSVVLLVFVYMVS